MPLPAALSAAANVADMGRMPAAFGAMFKRYWCGTLPGLMWGTLTGLQGTMPPHYGRVVEYTDFVADFAERTLTNLEYIESGSAKNDVVFPVTQLWNSLLGLIVLPRERDVGRIPNTGMAELWARGWPRITVAGREHRTLRQLLRDLRNAVSHFNVEFSEDSDREIHSVTVWVSDLAADGTAITDSRRWEGRMTVDELRRLARLIAHEYLQRFGSSAA